MKKIYSFSHGESAIPAMPGYTSLAFRLPARSSIEVSLKQFIFHVYLYDLVSGAPIPAEQNTVVNYNLSIFNLQGNIANVVDRMALAAAFTGDSLQFYQPGLYCFDGLVTTNEIRFNLSYRNIDPVAQIRLEYSLIIETDEKYI